VPPNGQVPSAGDAWVGPDLLPIHHLASSPGGLLSLAFADTPITFGRVPGMRLGRVGSDSELFEQNDRRKDDEHEHRDDDRSA
jgi:hypothetical protein